MSEQENQQSDLLKYMGIFLLVVGVLVAGAIVLEIFTFFSKPDENVLVKYLTSELSKTNFAELNENPVVLKESGAFAVSVVLFAMLLWSASSVCYQLIKAGLSILTRTYSSDIARLKLHVSGLSSKVEKFTSNR